MGKIERAWRWCRKKPLAAAMVVLVALLLTAAVVVPVMIVAREANAAQTLALEKDRTQLALKESRDNERKANEAVEQVRAAEKEKTEKLWQSYLDQARAGRVSSRVGQRFESLATLAETARIRPDLRLRNEAIACLALPDLRRGGSPFVVPAADVHRSPTLVQRAVCPVSGNMAMQAADDRMVEVHTPGGQLLFSLTHTTRVEHLHWRRDGRMLAVGVVQGPIHLWRTPEGKRQAVLEVHQSGVTTMEFSPDDRWLLTTSYDNTARLWDATDGRQVLLSERQVFLGPFSSDGARLRNGNAPVEFADGRECRVLYHASVGRGGDHSAAETHGPFSAAFHPNGELLATSTYGHVRLWDVGTGRVVGRIPTQQSGVAFARDGSLYTVVNGVITRWDVQTIRDGRAPEQPQATLRLPVLLVNDSTLSITRDGRRLLVSNAGASRAWVVDTQTGEVLHTFDQRACMQAVLSPDEKLITTSTWSWNPPVPIKVWDAETGRLVHQITRTPYARCAFSPDSKTLAVGSQSDYVFYEVGTWRPLHEARWGSNLPARLDYSPDGRLVAVTGSNYLVRLLDASTGKEVASLSPPEPGLICGIQFSPDGSRLVVLTERLRAFLWDLSAIRRQLAMIGLDWELPSLPDQPVRPGSRPIRPATPNLPPVVSLTGVAAWKPATDEEIRTWLEQLDSPQAGEVAKNLAAAGPAVLPHLERAETTAAAPRPLLRQIRDRIQRDAAVMPQRVTLKLDRVPLANAVTALAKESGLSLTLGNAGPVTVSLDFKDVPAWQALDELRRQANLVAVLSGGKILLNPGQGVDANLIEYPGQIRLQVARIQLMNTRVLGDQLFAGPPSTSMLGIGFNIATAPGGRIVTYGQPHCRTVQTDAGESLAPLSTPSTYFQPLPSVPTILSPFVSLKSPTRAAKTISLSGTLPVEIEKIEQTRTDIPDLRERLNRLIPLAEGGYLTPRAVQFSSGGSSVTLSLIPTDSMVFNPQKWSLELVEEDGRNTRGTIRFATTGGPLPVRPDELLWLATPGEIPWVVLTRQPRSGLQVTNVNAYFQTPTVPGVKTRLRLHDVERTTVDLPFAFKNVPLP